MMGRQCLSLGFIGAAATLLSACGGSEGTPPRTTEVQLSRFSEETARVEVHHLKNLSDPYADLYVSAEQGIFTQFGSVGNIEVCESDTYVCMTEPFLFSYPVTGRPSMAGWTIGPYQFVARHEVERDFCGRKREVFLIEGTDETGASTRVWYHPEFGIYAVIDGRVDEEGELTLAEAIYTTCERGLLRREVPAAG